MDPTNLLRQLPSAAFIANGDDDPIVTASVAVLRIAKDGRANEDVINSIRTVPKFGLPLLCSICAAEILNRDQREELVVAVIQQLESSADYYEELHAVLKKLLDARKSGLHERTMWVDKLKLPQGAFEVMISA